MIWKSRVDKLPPPSFFSLVVAYLQKAYKGAQISQEMMQTLRPFLVEAWQRGRSAEAAAQATCSCNGREVIPSPVIGVHIAKGSVRPPKGAQRGDVFGAEALRQPPQIERLQQKLQRVSREDQKQQTVEARWGERVQTSRSEATRREAERKQALAGSRRADLLNEAQRIESEIERLRSELNRAGRRGKSETTARPADEVSRSAASFAPPPPPPAAESTQPAPKKRGRKPGSRTAEPSAPVPSQPSTPSVETQSAAMLDAVKGLLPNLATQIAAQMTKDGEKK